MHTPTSGAEFVGTTYKPKSKNCAIPPATMTAATTRLTMRLQGAREHLSVKLDIARSMGAHKVSESSMLAFFLVGGRSTNGISVAVPGSNANQFGSLRSV